MNLDELEAKTRRAKAHIEAGRTVVVKSSEADTILNLIERVRAGEECAKLLDEVRHSGVSMDAEPPGVDWMEVQLLPSTWEAIQPAVSRWNSLLQSSSLGWTEATAACESSSTGGTTSRASSTGPVSATAPSCTTCCRPGERLTGSWLVQRLRKPRATTLGALNPFAFGGGLRNGGLTDEARTLLGQVFNFAYMGAAEFEFGAVPAALKVIADHVETTRAWSFTVRLVDVERHWRDTSTTQPTGAATVYVICRAEHMSDVEARVRQWAAGNERLKERTNLSMALRPWGNWDVDACGWLELDNGFFFFTDREMWEQTARLFGIEVPVD